MIGPDGKEKKLSSGWTSVEGILWSPAGDEIWFTSSESGSAANPRAVTLGGKLRTITNVPGGMWLEDLRNGVALTVTHQQRIGIRGMEPGGKGARTGLVRMLDRARHRPGWPEDRVRRTR